LERENQRQQKEEYFAHHHPPRRRPKNQTEISDRAREEHAKLSFTRDLLEMFFFHASARACLELKFCGPGLCVNFSLDSIDFDFNLSKKKSVLKSLAKTSKT